jgi:hypothetical protein
VYTVEVTLVPPAQHVHRRGALGPPLSGSANLDVLAPDSTLREELEQWRLRDDHFWGGYVSGNAATDLSARWPDAEYPPLARRQRKVKGDDGPFKGMVTIKSLAEDAGLPLDRVLRQAGGD